MLGILFGVGLLITVLVVIFVVGREKYQNPPETPYSPPKTCACVFDIDDTITCGFEAARGAVDACRAAGCHFAVNTARLKGALSGVSLPAVGLDYEDVKDDLYVGDWDRLGASLFEGHLDTKIAATKVAHLRTIAKKYNLAPRRVILFDDNALNVDWARKAGFGTVLASGAGCGLPNDSAARVSYLLR